MPPLCCCRLWHSCGRVFCSEGVCASRGSALLGRGPTSGLSLPVSPTRQPVWEVTKVLYCPDEDADLSGLRKWALNLESGGKKGPSAQLRKGEATSSNCGQAGTVISFLPQSSLSEPLREH